MKVFIIAGIILCVFGAIVLVLPKRAKPLVQVPDIIQQPTTTPPTPTPDFSSVKTQDVEVGNGTEAKVGDMVKVHYRGSVLEGKQFDESYSRGEPLSFVIGTGQMIQGFDYGVRGMRVGGKRTITIPPALGYGNQSRGEIIKPNSTLVFDIELVSVEVNK